LITSPDEYDLLEYATLDELERMIELGEWDKIEHAQENASEKQKAFQRAFFNRTDDSGRRCSKFVAIGGNRSGKTILNARLCFAKYLRDVARSGDTFWAGSQNLDRSIGGLQKELWEALPAGMFRGRVWDSKLGFGSNRTIQVRTRDGGYSTIEFRSADQDLNTFETAKLRGVIWDENLPEPLYNRLLPRLIDLGGFFLYSDINNQYWPITRLQEAPADAGVYYQNFTMYDNERNLPPGAIAEFSAGLTREEHDLRIMGLPGAMEGVVFKQYFDHIHAIDDFPIPGNGVPPFDFGNWPRWRLIDYGGSAPTACPWVTISPDEHLFVYREHYETGPSVASHAGKIILASADEQYVETMIDPAAYNTQPGMIDTIARQYEQAGIRSLRPWPRVNEMGEHAMVQKVKYRFENRTLWIFKSCVNMRRELRSWKHQLDKDGKPKASDAYENANNHLIDGLKGFVATNPTFAQPRIIVSGGNV